MLSNKIEDWQSWNNVFVDQVELIQEGVLWAYKSLHQALDVLLENMLVADMPFKVTIVHLYLNKDSQGVRVDELAPHIVWAALVLMKLLA